MSWSSVRELYRAQVIWAVGFSTSAVQYTRTPGMSGPEFTAYAQSASLTLSFILYSIDFDDMNSISSCTPCCHVVAIPYPGRGHINPMMNLCKLLASRNSNMYITVIVTEEWLGFIGSNQMPPSIIFQSIPNVIPSELVRAANFQEFIEAVFSKMEEPVERVLDRLDQPVSAIITDLFLSWAVALGNKKDIPVVTLWPMSPSVFSIYYYFDLLKHNGHFPVDLSERGNEVIDYIPGISSTRLADLPAAISGSNKQILCRLLEAFSWIQKAQCIMFTSFYELERKVIDNLKATLPCPVYSVGPLIPHTAMDSMPNSNMDDYFKWLDSQPQNSILYISLGSFLSVSKEQMDEIIEGVCASGVRCLWVARGDTSHIQEACGEKGLVLPWCDQLKVLCHPSVGGFWTHCGWNSTLEGVFAGVPMLTFPISYDQKLNRKLIVGDWKIGMNVKDVATDNVIDSKEISKIVQMFMELDGDFSGEMRRRATELKDSCRQALSQGGSSEADLDAFVKRFLNCQ
ncbi:hypothetical protein IFM89_025788 [Coptis chinensis]|uniref:Uncharacterized protein n=1 Tax=Coptis chinensis TaxID=261450 RepID=A0A835HE46_9MAGN|nr:hypothetical protein IFM89_025788 [Coptis chinensis]